MIVQLKRIKTGLIHNDTPLDNMFVKGNIARMPKVGESLVFYPQRFGDGWWTTTPIKEIVRRGQQTDFVTMNSIYTLVKGWGEPK